MGLIASTDAGIPGVRHHDLAAALREFAHFAGLQPGETLRAATSDCARALGIDTVTGAIDVGLEAALMVVEGAPLDDLAVLAISGPLKLRYRLLALMYRHFLKKF